MKLLNGAEIKKREEPGRKDETIKEGGREDRRGDMEFIEEDVGRAIERLKNKKAPRIDGRIDGIPMKAWRYGGATIQKGLTELLRRISNGDNLPEDWKTSVILPLYKKGDQEKTENYRGTSLLCSAYKIYAEMIRRKLEEETERLEVLPESQGGFTKGRGTMGNIFVLNHIVQREKIKREKKVFALFVDLKAAFDNIRREKLWSIIEELRST